MTPRSSLLLAVLAATLVAVPAGSAPVADTPLVSAGVELLGNVPDVGAIGGRVRTMPNGKRYFVMTSARGVSAYDVTIPETPVLAGHLALPHFENEDVDFGDDVLLISQDPGVTTEAGGGMYVLDISRLPLITFAYLNPQTANRFVESSAQTGGGRPGHTVSCVRVPGLGRCSWAYVNGSSVVRIIDLRDPAAPRVAGEFASPVGRTHDAQVDAAGVYWMVGSGGFAAYDTSDPDAPVLIGNHNPAGLDFHHNSWRPDADSWSGARADDGAVDAGEVLLVTEEDWLRPGCYSEGRFATAWLRGWDFGVPAGGPVASTQILDTWTTEASTYGLPTPTQRVPVPYIGELVFGESYNAAATCSAHYFDERAGIVAIGWYEQGTRFLDVSDPGDIRQVGYYVNPSGMTWDAEWIGGGTPELGGGEIVYTLDATRGIDVLRFDRSASKATVRAPVLPQWFDAAAPADVRPHPVWSWGCRVPVV